MKHRIDPAAAVRIAGIVIRAAAADVNESARWVRRNAALYRGVPVVSGGCRCAVCGESGFGVSQRGKAVVISDSFSDHQELLDPSAPDVCAGCDALLGGRPGDAPRPFRMEHVLIRESGAGALLPTGADVAAILADPPAGSFALVWAGSRKKHAWLRARQSTAARIVIGADDGPVVFAGEDRPLFDAVRSLLAFAGRGEVESGMYGVARGAGSRVLFGRLEAVVASRRPSAVLSMLCRIVPRPEPTISPPEEVVMLSPEDADGVMLLSGIAQSSALRRCDGLAFWRGIFRHRVQRFGRLPLPSMVARLYDELQCSPADSGAHAVNAALREWPEERQASCATAIRDRGALLVSLAFDERHNAMGDT